MEKRFVNVQRLPNRFRRVVRETAFDVLGFDPWSGHTPDWSWMKEGLPEQRIPLHTYAGFQIACVLYGMVLGFFDLDEVILAPGDFLSLVEEKAEQEGKLISQYYMVGTLNGENIKEPLPLREGVRNSDPSELLLSGLKIALAKVRDERYGPESRRVRENPTREARLR